MLAISHETAAGRDRLEQLAGDHFAPLAGLHVDDRALAGDGDALARPQPTAISTLIGATKFDSSRMPSRTTVVKPVSVKVTV